MKEKKKKKSFLLAALCAEGFVAVGGCWGATLDNRLIILLSHLLPRHLVHRATPTADDVVVMAGSQSGAVLHRSSGCCISADQMPPSAPCLPQQAKRYIVPRYQTPPKTTGEHDAGCRSHTLSTDTLCRPHITADR